MNYRMPGAVQVEFILDESGADLMIWITQSGVYIPDHLRGPAQQLGGCWDEDTKRWYATNDDIAAAQHQLLRPLPTSTNRQLPSSLQNPDPAPNHMGARTSHPQVVPHHPPPQACANRPPPTEAPQPSASAPPVASTSKADARVYYIVDYREKDEIKMLGCQWDRVRKAWYAPNAEVAAKVDATGRWERAPAHGSTRSVLVLDNAAERVYFSVPYAEKEVAKKMKMRFEKGMWYASGAEHATAVDALGRWPRAELPAQGGGVGNQAQMGRKRKRSSDLSALCTAARTAHNHLGAGVRLQDVVTSARSHSYSLIAALASTLAASAAAC